MRERARGKGEEKMKNVPVAFSALTFLGWTTNALETFFISSTMLKSSRFTIEYCPRMSCLEVIVFVFV